MKPLKVYVAGKYSANNTIETLKNIGHGRKLCAKLFEEGFSPYCPWHDATFIIDNPTIEISRRHFQECSKQWLLASDVLFVMSDSSTSVGTQEEIQLANFHSIPIFYNISDLQDYRYQLIQRTKSNTYF